MSHGADAATTPVAPAYQGSARTLAISPSEATATTGTTQTVTTAIHTKRVSAAKPPPLSPSAISASANGPDGKLDQSKTRRASYRIDERRDRQKDEPRANRDRHGEDHADRSSRPNHADLSFDQPSMSGAFRGAEHFEALLFKLCRSGGILSIFSRNTRLYAPIVYLAQSAR